MMAYPLEKDKGKAFAIFWAIFQFGSFIGSIIALAINIREGGLSAVSTSTYIVSTLPYLAISPRSLLRAGLPHHHLHWCRLLIPSATT